MLSITNMCCKGVRSMGFNIQLTELDSELVYLVLAQSAGTLSEIYEKV